MYRTSSPYIKELLKSGIGWMPLTKETLDLAVRTGRIIFLHIGNIADISRRKAALALFSHKEVVRMVNRNFIAIAVDSEDIPETYLAGMDLLLITEKRISRHINIFSLPGVKPFLSFSSFDPQYFLELGANILHAYRHNREDLEKLASILTSKLELSGRVTVKQRPRNLSHKLLHAYIRSWYSRFLDTESKLMHKPYTVMPKDMVLLLDYARKYQVKAYLDFIDQLMERVYYSPMFDPVDGGVFRQSEDFSLGKPLYEKALYDNCCVALLCYKGYQVFRKDIYREAAERIIAFITRHLKSKDGGYITYLSLNKEPEESHYYKYTLDELHKSFNNRYLRIAHCLGMNLDEEDDVPQIISNTQDYWALTEEDLVQLRKIRGLKKKELLSDKRVNTGYNCGFASTLCDIVYEMQEGDNTDRSCVAEYKNMAKEVVDTILQSHKAGSLDLYKYLNYSSTNYYKSDLYDYARVLNCILKLYYATQEGKYLNLAKTYTVYIIINHYQPADGMFSKTTRLTGQSPLKRSPVMDYNTMSSNSIMGENLLLLYSFTKNDIYIKTLEQQLYNIEPQLIGSGPYMTGWGFLLLNYLKYKEMTAPDSSPAANCLHN